MKRDFSIDVIKAFAAFSVIGVHFFLNSGFYNTNVEGGRMFISVIIRTFFMVCVPLFLLSTGGVMRKKELTNKYYLGIIPLLTTYLAACIACLIFRYFYLSQEMGFLSATAMIFDFTAAPYGWYVEMYLGLFMLIPFLNLGYSALLTRGRKRALVLTLFAMCTLPTLMNMWIKLIPDWFAQSLFPVMYYFMGAYILEYDIKIKSPALSLAALFGATVLFGATNFILRSGKLYGWTDYTLWGGLPTVVISVLLFITLRRISPQDPPKWIRAAVQWLSNITLGTYLLSYIFDVLVYGLLNSRVTAVFMRIDWLPAAVAAVYLMSVAAASAIELLRRCLEKSASKLIKR